MSLGFKARSLMELQDWGLPTLDWEETPYCFRAHALAYKMARRYDGNWALRIDMQEKTYPPQPLPLLGSNVGSHLSTAPWELMRIQERWPGCSFLVSEAPDEKKRDANAVVWMDGDEMLGEISFDPVPLRTAWVGGKLHSFSIDGDVQDYIRNPKDILTVNRVENLRKIRNLIKCIPHGQEYEISLMNNGRVIFWQQAQINDKRDWPIFKRF